MKVSWFISKKDINNRKSNIVKKILDDPWTHGVPFIIEAHDNIGSILGRN